MLLDYQNYKYLSGYTKARFLEKSNKIKIINSIIKHEKISRRHAEKKYKSMILGIKIEYVCDFEDLKSFIIENFEIF